MSKKLTPAGKAAVAKAKAKAADDGGDSRPPGRRSPRHRRGRRVRRVRPASLGPDEDGRCAGYAQAGHVDDGPRHGPRRQPLVAAGPDRVDDRMARPPGESADPTVLTQRSARHDGPGSRPGRRDSALAAGPATVTSRSSGGGRHGSRRLRRLAPALRRRLAAGRPGQPSVTCSAPMSATPPIRSTRRSSGGTPSSSTGSTIPTRRAPGRPTTSRSPSTATCSSPTAGRAT